MSESMQGISIELIGYPSENDWEEVKRRALITCWKDAKTPPGSDWKSRILNARHSPHPSPYVFVQDYWYSEQHFNPLCAA